MNLLPVSGAQGFAKHLHLCIDLASVGLVQLIVLVTKVLSSVTQKQATVLNVAGRKHGYRMRKTE
jgi:hypothetical protein